MYFMREIVN